ncbi:MAG: cell division protein SepF [Candidatus Thorarchaeota archaeon]
MRYLFRRRGENNNKEDTKNLIQSGLGIFSPVVDAINPDPTHECKRLAELEQIFVRSKTLQSLDDVPFVVDQIKNGNIVLLDITRLNDGQDQTHLELKRIIERIRGETRSYRADLALVNDNCVIVTPPFVKF